jgi:hypothetical protein
MITAKINDVLRFIKDMDENGDPSTRSKIASRVKSYLQTMDAEKVQLIALEIESENLTSEVAERNNGLTEMARQNQILKNELRKSELATLESGISALEQLRKRLEPSRTKLVEIEIDIDRESVRIAQLEKSHKDAVRALNYKRDAIDRRMDMIESLVKLAEPDSETVPPSRQSRTQLASKKRWNVAQLRGRRPRHIKIRRRRAA